VHWIGEAVCVPHSDRAPLGRLPELQSWVVGAVQGVRGGGGVCGGKECVEGSE
jgi:hypothetical protein